MVNVLSIQKHVNFGYSKIAKVTGDTYTWYRPDLALNPISGESYLGTLRAQFATDPAFVFYRPTDFPTGERWYGTFEFQANVQAGDVFIGQGGTYYAVYVERFVAIQCVWCNRTLSVQRAQDVLLNGASTEYSGQSVEYPINVMQNWPGSLRQLGSGMKMRGTDMRLPSDAPLSAYGVFLPSLPGTPIQWNDIVLDDLGRRYTITALELSQLGWRMAVEAWPT